MRGFAPARSKPPKRRGVPPRPPLRRSFCAVSRAARAPFPRRAPLSASRACRLGGGKLPPPRFPLCGAAFFAGHFFLFGRGAPAPRAKILRGQVKTVGKFSFFSFLSPRAFFSFSAFPARPGSLPGRTPAKFHRFIVLFKVFSSVPSMPRAEKSKNEINFR